VAVAVNLSARQFEAQDMVALVMQVLLETGLDSNFFWNWSSPKAWRVGNAESFIAVTKGLKDVGVTLSIDDFGTAIQA